MQRKITGSKIYLAFVFVLLYLPIFYLIYYSFNAGGTMNAFIGFTFEHYRAVLADKRLFQIVVRTLLLALSSSLVATLIGTFGAVLIY